MPAGRAGEASFGYDLLECKKCGCFMELVEIWEPQRGHPVPDVSRPSSFVLTQYIQDWVTGLCRGVWMKRWLETHRMRKAARDALSARLTARPARLTQLAFTFDDTS